MNNFSINPNISFSGFENNLSNFNIDKSNKSFDEIFNSIGQKPLEGGIEVKGINPQDAIGNLNSININGIENQNGFEELNQPQNSSATAQMASDIGSGFKNSLNELNEIQRAAEKDFETFASGGDISVHDVMISAQKSNLSMQMAIQVRNQMINAYNEFKNMAI